MIGSLIEVLAVVAVSVAPERLALLEVMFTLSVMGRGAPSTIGCAFRYSRLIYKLPPDWNNGGACPDTAEKNCGSHHILGGHRVLLFWY